MVRLVLVAHSRALADRLVDFVRQMAGDEVPICVAAGTGPDGADFGTDATAILDALTDDPPDAGQLVLVDVGSAVMSAEMALEMLPDRLRDHVRLSPAPFVEGTLSAAVQASLGASLDTVAQEAAAAMQQKQEALPMGDAAGTGPPGTASGAAPTIDEAAHVDVVLRNRHGLHARPAAQLVRTAAQFDAEITVENRTDARGPVSATSISSVATLGATHDHRLRLAARGPEADAALKALAALIEDGFGETDDEAEPSETPSPPSLPDRLPTIAAPIHGVAVADGIAIGPAYVHRPTLPDLPTDPPDDPAQAWADVLGALDAVRTDLEQEYTRQATADANDAAGIVDAQRLLLDDDALRDRVRTAILDARRPPARAWMDAVESVAEAYAELDDAYMQQRADDVRDVGRRVVREILDLPPASIAEPDAPFVLVADVLTPSEATMLDSTAVRGVVCAAGTPTSHSAILLRSQGIPAVFGVGTGILAVNDGAQIALSGTRGTVWIRPDEATAEALRRQQQSEADAREARLEAAQEDATTPDGTAIRVDANVNRPADASAAARNGADGVGLLRTEFLFVDRETPPTEDEQVEALVRVATALKGKPLVVRALDVGGDKPLPYVPMPDEPNPFLGVRGIRVLLRQPDLFKTQLRALLRVAADHPLRLMLPMVTLPSEVEAAREVLDAAREELDAEGLPTPDTLPLGVMIETPASALAARRFAEIVDFFSIGTNDLTQYTMAADRDAGRLPDVSDAFHPPVLALIRHVVEAADGQVPVSVCGEMAAEALAVPLLLGLGIRRLSVAPPAIPRVKAAVRMVPLDAAQALAQEALDADIASAVRDRCQHFVQTHGTA